MSIVGLIDTDIILHRASSGVQSNYEWDNGVKSVSADFAAARDKAEGLIGEYGRAIHADRLVLCLSDPTSNYFRRQLLPTYKSHRSGTPKPVLFGNLRDWIRENYEVVWRPFLEADDCLGILSTHPTKYPGTKVIVSTDKDMLQIPGLLYRPHKPKDGVLEITPAEADRWHLIQTLTGDSTDGFKGIPGVGPKRAEKILNEDTRHHTTHHRLCPCSAWWRVRNAYADAGLSYDDCLLQARVARILRHGDYHQGIGVRLWSPDLNNQENL